VLIATETPRFVWYLMRGTGFVALILFTLTVLLGIVGVTRLHSPRWPRLVTGELHRNVALTATCFLGLHIVTALIDSWVGLGWIGAVVPFHATYRPLWLGAGVVAFDTLLAVVASSLLRRRIGARVWRLIHWGAWIMWPMAVLHALGAGTDSTRGWGLGIVLICVGAVGAGAAWRVRFANRHRALPPPARPPTPPIPTRPVMSPAATEPSRQAERVPVAT
jgi:sulfoxide reductase heme-binding subunit YedZ